MPSITETARAILMKESNDTAPDRDAKSTTENKNTLRPKSKSSDAPQKLDGEVQDLGDAITSPDDERKGPAIADMGVVGKDKSKVHNGEDAPEPMQKLSEDELDEDETLEEEIEMTEELENFIAEKIDEGLDEDAILEAIEQNFEIVSEDETIQEEVDEDYPIIETPVVDMVEHVEALFAGEQLSEDFKQKAKTIFEAAVNERLVAEAAKLQAAYKAALVEEVERIENQLSEAVEDHLNYAVDQWITENEVAIESGLRSELTEEFIAGLRQLFVENYIDIPEEKISVVEELGAKVQELTEKLNEQIEINVAQNKLINEARASDILDEMVDGLTDTQIEKLKALAEGIEFESADEYKAKIKTLRESYFPTKVVNDNATEKVATEDGGKLIVEDGSDPMDHYARALGRWK